MNAYTAILEKQDVSFNEFVWRCARAFGPLIHMREEPFNKEITLPKKDSYRIDSLRTAKASLEEYQDMNLAQAQIFLNIEYYKTRLDATIEVSKKTLLRNRTEKMLNQITDWQAPTVDHEELKSYMIAMCKDTLKYDCETEYYQKKLDAPKPETQQWLNDKINFYQEEINYHTKHLDEDKKHYRNDIDWIIQLQESVPLPEQIK